MPLSPRNRKNPRLREYKTVTHNSGVADPPPPGLRRGKYLKKPDGYCCPAFLFCGVLSLPSLQNAANSWPHTVVGTARCAVRDDEFGRELPGRRSAASLPREPGNGSGPDAAARRPYQKRQGTDSSSGSALGPTSERGAPPYQE